MQILAKEFFEAMKHAVRNFIAWVTKIEKPRCSNPECGSDKIIPTGKFVIHSLSPVGGVMSAGDGPTFPIVLRQFFCFDSRERFWV